MRDISLHTSHLHEEIKQAMVESSTIYILNSFIMKSGVEMIFNALEHALKNGADVKILTGDYLYVTQPKALHRLLDLQQDNLEIRLWKSNGVSFHPKTYIFKHKEKGSLIVGSSNMSRSAYTSGVEWNLQMQRAASNTTFDEAMEAFIGLFYADETMSINAESLKIYQQEYDQFHATHADLLTTWTKQEEVELTLPSEEEPFPAEANEPSAHYPTKLQPRQAQIEALTALEATLEEEYNKAMVVMATGLGKTYLAAFFAKRYKRILFIAHREEILKQAKKSFEQVMGKQGGLFYGLEKDTSKDMLFASIFTLSIQEQLHQFAPDTFDLIIVDEFHHAAVKSYQHVIDYFKPQFLLGLTATPERTDGQDVFAICEGNVAYEITFIEAIQSGWLTPFTYHGILDDIDYSSIRWLGTKYDQHELMIQQLQTERAQHIYRKWKELKKTRTLGFCSSIQQAEFLANYFNESGAQALALTSQSKTHSRTEIIRLLEAGELDIIFTVDLFNEGVDIPSVDTLLFARPTESLVVFTQQIGRGLRTFAGKNSCVIIDLIGNYRYADTKLSVFDTEEKDDKKGTRKNIEPIVPTTCEVHLDTAVIDVLQELRKKRSPRRDRIFLDYYQVKTQIGRRPTYREVHLYGNINSKEYKQAFGGYFAFLKTYGELTEHEATVYEKHYNWLSKVEKETMTKSYKMVVLQYLLDKGPSDWLVPVTPEEVAPYFHQFYMEKNYRRQIDFSSKNTKAMWEYDEKKVAKLIADMPMSKWVGKDELIFFKDGKFGVNFTVNTGDREILHRMTGEICDFKMQGYFERKSNGSVQ
ncbi:DEAD/DEAH box helicase family protein [Virgibacillus halodenitrificans]|uniref:DEAD/DEAH box helicase family protein n=1 Tax=Virgibacillus halodenitrificans TaxID=1482 RepID=UPI002DD43E2E|nr:DEAD/DEAH box helicase family protein [Virgibacillus halodenitrificans]